LKVLCMRNRSTQIGKVERFQSVAAGTGTGHCRSRGIPKARWSILWKRATGTQFQLRCLSQVIAIRSLTGDESDGTGIGILAALPKRVEGVHCGLRGFGKGGLITVSLIVKGREGLRYIPNKVKGREGLYP
jgi:hypothetical protein